MPWTVAGQDAAIAKLQRAIEHQRVAHAYLFSGAAHVGKTLTATQFAQALNCTGNAQSDTPPCGRCRQCEHIASGTHPDVEVVAIGGLCAEESHDHAHDTSRDIRVCQVRRIERLVSRAPFEGRYRVIIIDPADSMNQIAQNALLKTLEEPPPGVVIILISEQEERLLDTIRSRTRRVAAAGVARDTVEQALRTRWNVEPERAATLARLAGGRIGWAVLALSDERMLEDREQALTRAGELAAAPIAERFAFANELGSGYTRDRARVQATLETWQEWWRDILLIAARRPESVTHTTALDTLRALAAQCDVAAAARALRAITEARQHLEENASPVLALEAMMLALPELRENAVAGRLAGA